MGDKLDLVKGRFIPTENVSPGPASYNPLVRNVNSTFETLNDIDRYGSQYQSVNDSSLRNS